MKLHEYRSKRLFAKNGIPIPKGNVATTPTEAREIAEILGQNPATIRTQLARALSKLRKELRAAGRLES